MRTFLTVFALLTASVSYSQVYVKVLVTHVHDGDGLNVMFSGGERERIRIAGIDAPEVQSATIAKNQAGGVEARDSLAEWAEGKYLLIDTFAIKYGSRDRYGRLLADVYTLEGESIQERLVGLGLAWDYPVRNRRNKRLAANTATLMEQAKHYRVGIWGKAKSPMLPSKFREKYKSN